MTSEEISAGVSGLEGQVAVVTGASRGIGKAIAIELARLGADVVVASRSDALRAGVPGTIHQTVDAIRAAGGRAHPAHVDVGFQFGIEALVAETLATFGRADILVNNSAITNRLVFLSVDELTREQFERQLSVNLVAPLMLTKAFLPAMRSAGSGIVINMTSFAARMGQVDEPVSPAEPRAGYSVTKYALERLTHQVAHEVYSEGIACIAVDPGGTMTELKESLFETGSPLDAARTQVDPETTHPVWWPARVVGFLAASADRMSYSGRVVVTTREFLDAHRLLEGAPSEP